MPIQRQPAVAGTFYPADPDKLRKAVANYLAAAAPSGAAPKALIVPHAGYQYSAPIAANAYAQLAARRSDIGRVVLIGPSHHIAFVGLAIVDATSFATPLGPVPIDQSAASQLLQFRQVQPLNPMVDREHCLEVQLPFLQYVLDDFQIVPLLVGQASPPEVAEPLEAVWGGAETLIVVSSDLSHYHAYAMAQALDKQTSEAITRLAAAEIAPDQACGCRAIGGLLELARKYGLTARTLDLRNSGDTAGPRDQVVGYGAFAFAQAG